MNGPQIQVQGLVAAMQKQRNAALDMQAQLEANLALAQAQLEEAGTKIKALEAQVRSLQPTEEAKAP
jgi:hypothetical protein